MAKFESVKLELFVVCLHVSYGF